MTLFPYCFFPTRIMCIGNEPNHVESLVADDASLVCFDNPEKALSYLKEQEKSKILFERIFHQYGEAVDCNSVFYLYEEIYNPDRFQTISCVLIDEQVQGIKGLEICRQITDPHIQKIFLTSSLEAETVINAFNQGWIDYYLPKIQPDFHDHLQNLVKRANNKYFERLTTQHMTSLLKQWGSEPDDISPLTEPCFKSYLTFLLESPNIQEYYPLDLMGSFLLINTQGQASALLAFTERSLARHMQDARAVLEREPELWDGFNSQLLPSSFCIPALYHPIFQDLKPFVVPVYPQKFGQQHYNLALVSQIGNTTPSLRDLGVLHLQERN